MAAFFRGESCVLKCYTLESTNLSRYIVGDLLRFCNPSDMSVSSVGIFRY